MALKRNRVTWGDELSRMQWQSFERLLADHYRDAGYAVEHCGTAASGGRYDGGVDLVLRRDGETTLVQCKHWNAAQVPHNDVHQLLGLLETRGAQRAILVTSGEFTHAAWEAARRSPRITLVDGSELRRMIDPRLIPALPDLGDVDDPAVLAAGHHFRQPRRLVPRRRPGGVFRAIFTIATLAGALLVVAFGVREVNRRAATWDRESPQASGVADRSRGDGSSVSPTVASSEPAPTRGGRSIQVCISEQGQTLFTDKGCPAGYTLKSSRDFVPDRRSAPRVAAPAVRPRTTSSAGFAASSASNAQQARNRCDAAKAHEASYRESRGLKITYDELAQLAEHVRQACADV